VEVVEQGHEDDPLGTWHQLPRTHELGAEELFDALAEMPSIRGDRELALRRRAWWRGNDPFRDDPPSEAPLPEGRARKNLVRLFELETAPEIRAAIARHLAGRLLLAATCVQARTSLTLLPTDITDT
jgi:hypothetical protein